MFKYVFFAKMFDAKTDIHPTPSCDWLYEMPFLHDSKVIRQNSTMCRVIFE